MPIGKHSKRVHKHLCLLGNALNLFAFEKGGAPEWIFCYKFAVDFVQQSFSAIFLFAF